MIYKKKERKRRSEERRSLKRKLRKTLLKRSNKQQLFQAKHHKTVLLGIESEARILRTAKSSLFSLPHHYEVAWRTLLHVAQVAIEVKAMDVEDIVTCALNSVRIFKNRAVLSDDYLSKELPFREEETKIKFGRIAPPSAIPKITGIDRM